MYLVTTFYWFDLPTLFPLIFLDGEPLSADEETCRLEGVRTMLDERAVFSGDGVFPRKGAMDTKVLE